MSTNKNYWQLKVFFNVTFLVTLYMQVVLTISPEKLLETFIIVISWTEYLWHLQRRIFKLAFPWSLIHHSNTLLASTWLILMNYFKWNITWVFDAPNPLIKLKVIESMFVSWKTKNKGKVLLRYNQIWEYRLPGLR